MPFHRGAGYQKSVPYTLQHKSMQIPNFAVVFGILCSSRTIVPFLAVLQHDLHHCDVFLYFVPSASDLLDGAEQEAKPLFALV